MTDKNKLTKICKVKQAHVYRLYKISLDSI